MAVIGGSLGDLRQRTAERVILDAVLIVFALISLALALVLGVVVLAQSIGLIAALVVFLTISLALTALTWVVIVIRARMRKAEAARRRAEDRNRLLTQAALAALPLLRSGKGIAIGLAVLGVMVAMAGKGDDDGDDDPPEPDDDQGAKG